MARTSWLDAKADSPLIQQRVEKLASFTNALADGIVTKQDLGGAMVWSLDADTDNGALTTAIFNGLTRHDGD